MIFREPSILFHRAFTLKKYNSCITAAGAGRVSATAADDGLVANDGVLISGGTLAVTAGGGSANTAVKTGNAMFGGWDAGTAEEETTSMKGVKAQTALEITGGTLTVSGGEITVTQSYEGIEAGVILVTGGTIDVTASDDGFNAAGGTDDSAENGMFGPDAFASDATKTLTFEGGTGNLGGMQAPDGMQQPGGRAFRSVGTPESGTTTRGEK